VITVYASEMSRSRRVLWVCEEAAAPYTVVELAWPPRQHPDFLKINPAGTVPAIADGDLVLTESLAICEYVARRHRPELVVEPDRPDYWTYLQWLQFGEGTLQPPVAWARRYGPLSPDAMQSARDAFAIRAGALDQALADGREWIAAGRFTIADISLGFPLILAPAMGLKDLMPPGVQAYRDRLRARPACRRAYGR
jgi:glutathione S-transferase